VRFTDASPIDDDPQAKLLNQVQGVIAEYERRRSPSGIGAGSCSAPARGRCWPGAPPTATGANPATHGPARLEVFQPEATVVRRIFDDYVHGGHSLREIIRRLAADGFPPPAGRDRLWGTSTLSTLLRNQANIGEGLHRADLRQPHRGRPRPPPRAAQQAGPPPPRGLDRHRGARHRR
jgi:site-specific DNA recombinase